MNHVMGSRQVGGLLQTEWGICQGNVVFFVAVNQLIQVASVLCISP